MTHVTERKFKVVERREIDGERAFPIYHGHVEFTQLLRANKVRDLLAPGSKTYPWKRGPMEDTWNVPVHRFYNMQTSHLMPLDPFTPEQQEEQVFAMIGRMQTQHPDAIVLRASMKIVRWETWCCHWFNHWTHPFGRTDQELVFSFSRYVNRHSHYQDMLGEWENHTGEWPICLMGAEDHWRWRADPKGRGQDEPEKIICRCEHCVKQGVVRISH